jgi:pilus assembly protein CpaE
MGILELSEAICLVTEPLVPTLVGTVRCLECLDEQGFARERVRLILNRQGFFSGAPTAHEVSDQLGRSVAASVPFDWKAVDAADTGKPLASTRGRSEFSKAIRQLCEKLPAFHKQG